MSSPWWVGTEQKEELEMARYVVVWNVSRGPDGLLGVEMETTDDTLSAVRIARERNGLILEMETAEELMKKLRDIIPALEGWSE